ncbi:MAG: YdeI/OmpD-associated family protein [Cyclobacteriaceae bacterium]
MFQWIQSAKREETRIKRIYETVNLAQKNIRAHQYTPKN